ncbi:SRPBCC family protein [Flavobacterium pallidum]|uniref:SRPBCC family protein n=1 Tax=Flavobacterium pallidum TaxID=2172098 RepID=A0A2S1SIA4_9FLAO|nr:SRPBCC family protein [Flavobacterium pallidum]AWI26111.1 SRPBCC family protein [Flavobacterium pallidum]
MRYTLSNTIEKPLAEVVRRFQDPEGVKHWMEGLQKIEPQSGTPGEVGAKTDFYFLHRNKEMKISETILEQNMPHQMKFAYRSPMGYNEVEMVFEKISDHSVKQTSNSYFQFKGLMKIMAFLFTPMFKKQSMKYMTAFKNYVEKHS